VAQQFQVTKKLVGCLVRESRLQPEKHEEKRQLELRMVEKKSAIEDAVASLLYMNIPIYRAG